MQSVYREPTANVLPLWFVTVGVIALLLICILISAQCFTSTVVQYVVTAQCSRCKCMRMCIKVQLIMLLK